MSSDGKSIHVLERLASISLLKSEQWERYKYLRGGLALAMVICTLGSGVGWYQFATGESVSLARLVLMTLFAVGILMAAPRKGDLITLTFAGVFVLSIIGTLLQREPLGVGLALIGASGALLFIWSYLMQKLGTGAIHAGKHQ